jgi:hypothetical protein
MWNFLNTNFVKFAILSLAVLLTSLSWSQTSTKTITIEELKNRVSGPSHDVAYAGKEDGYYYADTNAEHRTGWQGWYILSVKMMDDYRIAINGEALGKQDVDKTEVYHDQIHRSYKNGVQEVITMIDSIDALVVELQNIRGSAVSVSPLFDGSHSRNDYIINWKQKVLLVAKKRHQEQSTRENYPVWIGITSAPLTTPIDTFSDSIDEPPLYGPVRLSSRTWHSGITFIFVAGDSVPQTIALARDVAKSYPGLIRKRKQKME